MACLRSTPESVSSGTPGRKVGAGALLFVTLAAGSLPGLGLNPSSARALGHHKSRRVVVIPADDVPVSTGRAYVVRTYRTVPADEPMLTDEGSRSIEVRRLVPAPSEVGRARAMGEDDRGASRSSDGGLPPLLKTRLDADGRRVPQVSGDEPLSGSRSAESERRDVVVRSSPPAATSRTVVKRYVTTRTVTRSVPTTTRTVRAAEPAVLVREQAAPTVFVRESMDVAPVEVLVVKKKCHLLFP